LAATACAVFFPSPVTMITSILFGAKRSEIFRRRFSSRVLDADEARKCAVDGNKCYGDTLRRELERTSRLKVRL
jgi:hypothetical protein